jgi:CxxC-x17-CxxC domain-containing protein
MDYGMDFDFDRSFFEQFNELRNKVPHFSVFIIDGTLQNSDFTNCVGYLKNCYLIGESDYDEDCYYSNLLKHSKNLVDCSTCYECEIGYECTDCIGCYNLKYSQDCENCKNGYFLKDCIGCEECIGCINQVRKRFMIFNKPYSEDEYKMRKEKFNLETQKGVEDLKVESEKFFDTQFHKNLHEDHNENSLGDHLYHSKNSDHCFDSKDLEDCKYCSKVSLHVKNSMDYSGWGMNCELIYQCSACGDNINNLKFCSTCTTSLHDCEYSEQCSASSDLFGCFGLKRKKYCILNKQYSKEDYEKIKARIIEHMLKTGEYGEFMPLELCPFAYNETIAMDYYPISKEEAISQGYKWKDSDEKEFKKQTKEILACENCKKNYKIIEPEWKFYQANGVPAPRFCPDCRHLFRMRRRPAPELHERECNKCGAKTISFTPEKNRIIYCKKCYLESVY